MSGSVSASASVSPSKVIAVFGATGHQGGSVIRSLANIPNNNFILRGITRNPQSTEAQKLLSSLPKSSELVSADITDEKSVEKALTGAWGVFLVTTYDPRQTNTEEHQAKLVADAAIKAGVKFFVFSSLVDAKTISQGRHKVSHFTAKNQAEQYIRTLPFSDGVSFAYPGFFASNLVTTMKPQKNTSQDIPVYEFKGLFRNDVALPIVDIDEEFGTTVKEIFLSPDKYNQKCILTGVYTTMPQLADTFSKALGIPAKYIQLPAAVGKNLPEEMYDMIQFFNNFGYYGGAAVNNITQPTDLIAFWKRHASQF